MKLLMCPECYDVVKLLPGKLRTCECGYCSGVRTEEGKALITAGSVALGAPDPPLRAAFAEMVERHEGRHGTVAQLFVLPVTSYLTLTEEERQRWKKTSSVKSC